MLHKNTYEEILSSILKSVHYIKRVDDEKEMSNAYIDAYVTKEQRKRDQKVTELLEEYVSVYKSKSKSNKIFKIILFGCNCFILVAFAIAFLFIISRVDFSGKSASVASVVEVISVCVTFLALIVKMLETITKYVFPEKEDEYITQIVGIIQNNDLENKKENIRVHAEKRQEKQKGENNIEIIEEL